MSQRLPRRPLGRRRRRLYWTVAILTVATVAGTAVGIAVFQSSRGETYRPGERSDDVTRSLDRGIPDEAPEPRFTDVTADAGLGDLRTFVGRRSSQLPEDMGSGAAWGDYDGDGDDDLFVVSSGGPLTAAPSAWAPSVLYENRGDGTFARSEGFPDTRIVGMGAAWGDYDGDGRLDLVVTGFNELRLYHNAGDRLVPSTAIESRPGFWSGVSWSDFDRDGDLDLYVCGYIQYVPAENGDNRVSKQYGRDVPYTLNPASYEPAANLLFRNDGDGKFAEVAEELGVSNPEGRSLGALWHDFDDDGWPDLYVANDISDNALYLNRSGRFEDASHAAWVADYRGAMGLAAGDWNRDGDDDLMVTHWIAQENALYDSLREDQRGDGPGGGGKAQGLRFIDVADQRGLGQIALQHVGWGVAFADLDADGWLDLVVANGSTFEQDGSPERLLPETSFLLWNRRGEYFHDLAPLSQAFGTPRVSRGLAVADYDLDGDLDLLFVDNGDGVRLLRNDMQQGGWVELRLLARLGAAGRYGPADGARVIARVGETELRRTVSSASYLSQDSRRVHVGVGDADHLDSLEVRWPSGDVQQFENVGVNAMWELREGEPSPRPALVARALTREQLVEFWRLERAGMNAVKVDRDYDRAIESFRGALALDPRHEDSLYYLGNCLAETGRIEEAQKRFAEIMELNPMSHRAFKRWGTLRAITASTDGELDEAARALEHAVAINPEATGAPLLLAEIAVVRGRLAEAEERLLRVRRTNPDADDAAFLLAYVRWRDGDEPAARALLERAAEGQEKWRPADVVAEGDVREVMHSDPTLLRRFYESGIGSKKPAVAFRPLDAFVRTWRRPASKS